MKSLAVAFLVGAALVAGVRGEAPAGDMAAVARNNNEFGLELYRRLAEKPGNRFFSPYSISNALAMTYAGARGQTAAEMARTMHFTLAPERFHRAFGDLVRALQGKRPKRDKFELRVANRLWGQKDYGFLPRFLRTTEDNYDAGLKEVDFVNATEEARKTINAWVEKETNERIKELIQPGILNPMTRLVLTNAIYFKAAWLRPFDKGQTRPGQFTTAEGKKVKVPLMHQNLRARYFDGGTFQALELPYSGPATMIVLLPKKADGLHRLEKDLTLDNLQKWLGKLSVHQVDVTLPRFKMTDEFLLNDTLKAMGMELAFDRNRADFSGMATREQLFISAVVHKAFVEVNEAGTEAAAATGVVIEARSAPPPATFRADHPFVYLIRDNQTGSILFMGRVVNPS